ncbi:hypothetical protein GCM10027093_31230 [Paraburkholderia jirisanensis]
MRGSFTALALAFACVSGGALALISSSTPAAAAPSQSIALLNCALLDDNAEYNDAELTRAQLARAAMISDTLRAQLRERALYRVADNAPAHALIAGFEASQNLHACNGCEREIGRQLGVDKVGVCWVQKISNLIININLRIEAVKSGQIVFQRSVDIRGNTDIAWQRGATALVDLLAAGSGAP